jgi:hypothetical protein
VTERFEPVRRLAILTAALCVAACAPSTQAGRSTQTTSDGTFSVTISVPATAHHASDALDVLATLTYLGPQPSIGVDGDSVGLVFFTFKQLDGTRSMAPVSIEICAAPATLQRQVPATFRPTKFMGWDGEDPNAAFYHQWVSDPEVHLPTGRWQIVATAQIWLGTACYSSMPDHKLVTPPLVLDVTP